MDRYVIDTSALISYFSHVFDRPSQISQRGLKIIDSSFRKENSILIIPSIVFIEIFKKWYKDEEWSNKIRYEVYEPIKSKSNIEIKPIEQEVLENFIKITDIEPGHNFDNHDKQILASAMMLNAPLISSDARLIRYNEMKKVIPAIIC